MANSRTSTTCSQATSVAVVDLVARKTGERRQRFPVAAWCIRLGRAGLPLLCADGSLAYAAKQGNKYTVKHTAQFFDGENDPGLRGKPGRSATPDRAFFISYTGMVYPRRSSAMTCGWMRPGLLQEAAGMPRATTQSELLAWRPGGGRFAAYHKASGRLFVLMHAGAHWTHKKRGNGDLGIRRQHAQAGRAVRVLEKTATLITVTQDDKPLLFVVGGGFEGPPGDCSVLDPQTGEVLRGLGGISAPWPP